MKDFLNYLESFIKSYGFYLALALLLIVVIVLVIDIFVVASVNKKIKKLEQKLKAALKKEQSISCPVEIDATQKITGEKTFTSVLKGYPVVIDKNGEPKIVNHPRDNKGRFIKANK